MQPKTAKDLGLVVPTVHLNGTGRRALSDGFAESASAIRAAMETIASHGPNGRDYYVQDPSAFGRARDQHDARLDRMRASAAEFDALCEAVSS